MSCQRGNCFLFRLHDDPKLAPPSPSHCLSKGKCKCQSANLPVDLQGLKTLHMDGYLKWVDFIIMDQMSAADPDCCNCWILKLLSQELLKTHKNDWCGPWNGHNHLSYVHQRLLLIRIFSLQYFSAVELSCCLGLMICSLILLSWEHNIQDKCLQIFPE